jgi:hypothetical protein
MCFTLTTFGSLKIDVARELIDPFEKVCLILTCINDLTVLPHSERICMSSL